MASKRDRKSLMALTPIYWKRTAQISFRQTRLSPMRYIYAGACNPLGAHHEGETITMREVLVSVAVVMLVIGALVLIMFLG